MRFYHKIKQAIERELCSERRATAPLAWRIFRFLNRAPLFRADYELQIEASFKLRGPDGVNQEDFFVVTDVAAVVEDLLELRLELTLRVHAAISFRKFLMVELKGTVMGAFATNLLSAV